jgi:CheY-like chemotaxis protein
MKPYVLLVDDSPKDVEIISSLLEELSADDGLVVLNDGEAALNYLYRRFEYSLRSSPQPYLILLDIKMPKVSGLEVLKAMKSDANLESIPVVLVSSSRAEKDLAMAFEYQANGYVIKPIRVQQLAAAIDSAARHNG